MAGYWIKAYIEIIDDPKMATLPDRLWRRVMELFLLAGKYNDGGNLPDTKELAWLLRTNTDDLDGDLQQIKATGIIQRMVGGWMVVNFSKRQAPTPNTERVNQYRQRQRHEQYTGEYAACNEGVTKRYIDIDKDIDKESDEEEESNSPPATPPTKIIQPKPPSIMNIVNRASNLSAIPPKEEKRIEQIHCMLDRHGPERTEEVLKRNCEKWCATIGKNGRPYPVTNMGWVDWAQEELDNSTAMRTDRPITQADWDRMTQDQQVAHIMAGRPTPA